MNGIVFGAAYALALFLFGVDYAFAQGQAAATEHDGEIIKFLYPIITALIAAAVSYWLSRRKAKVDLALAEKKMTHERELVEKSMTMDLDKLRREYQLEYSAERVVIELLNDKDWNLRSFGVLKHHLRGFEDDELRKLLIRAGAICFKNKKGVELWGLLTQCKHLLGSTKLDATPQYRLKKGTVISSLEDQEILSPEENNQTIV